MRHQENGLITPISMFQGTWVSPDAMGIPPCRAWSLLTGGQLDSSGPAEHLEFDSVRKKTSVGEGCVPLAGPRVTGLLVCQKLLQRESVV